MGIDYKSHGQGDGGKRRGKKDYSKRAPATEVEFIEPFGRVEVWLCEKV